MKRILISAYDVNPYRGSESATGWNYPFYLSNTNKVTVVTRKNNLPDIQSFIEQNDINTDNLEFVGFDLPAWARFWKKGVRGSFLYFYLWQLFLGLSYFFRRNNYDVCHSLNFHCDWAPSFLWLLGKPFIWGPINHNEELPDYMLQGISNAQLIREKIKKMVKNFFWNCDPFLYICKHKATKILVGHSGVIKKLRLDQKKYELFNQIATNVPNVYAGKVDHDDLAILFVGRGLPIKNYEVVLEAFVRSLSIDPKSSDAVSLTFIGVGSRVKYKLENMAKNRGVDTKVSVIEWVPFEKINEYYRKSDALCFPSFEGAGMVIAEALAQGVPVITIDRNGAANELDENCCYIISSDSKDEMIDGIAVAMFELRDNKQKRNAMSKKAYKLAFDKLSWSAKSKRISNIYSEIG